MSTPAIPRLIAMTYGDLTVSTSDSDFEFHDVHLASGAYDEASCSFVLVLTAASTASLKANRAELEDAFSRPNEAFSLTVNSQVLYSWDPAADSGFLTRASWELLDTHRSDKSCAYRVTVSAQLPADETGKGGRREASVTITPSPEGIERVAFEAVYTALSGTGATATAEANFPTWVAAEKSALGITNWAAETGLEIVDTTSDDKVARARQVYREILLDQDGSGAVSSTLRNPVYTVDVVRQAGPNSPGYGAEALVVVRARASTGVVKTETDLESVYQSTVKPYMETLASAKGNPGGAVHEIGEDVNLDPHNNRIEAEVEYLVPVSSLHSLRIERSERVISGKTIHPVANASAYAADIDEGPAFKSRRVSVSTIEDRGASQGIDRIVAAEVSAAESAGFVFLESDGPDVPIRYELSGGGNVLELVERVRVLSFRYVEDPADGLSSRAQGAVS